MSNQVFPLLIGQSWPVVRRQLFSVQVRTSQSQREVSTILNHQCGYEFEVSWDLLRNKNGSTELQQIEGLFLSMRGSYDYFMFTDLMNYQVTNGVIGVGDGSNRFFVLGRNTGPNYYEAVGHLNQLTGIYFNGIIQPQSSYSFSAPNIIVFNSAPADGVTVTATFTFYYICRFGQDLQEYEQFMYNLYQLNSVILKTVDY